MGRARPWFRYVEPSRFTTGATLAVRSDKGPCLTELAMADDALPMKAGGTVVADERAGDDIPPMALPIVVPYERGDAIGVLLAPAVRYSLRGRIFVENSVALLPLAE